MIDAIAWAVSTPPGWAAPPAVVGALLLSGLAMGWVAWRAIRAQGPTPGERDDVDAHARLVVDALRSRGWSDAAIRRELLSRGGARWAAAVDRALERRGYRVAHPCPACGGALLSYYETLYYGQMVTCTNCAAKCIVAYSAADPVSPEERWPASLLAAHIELYRSAT